MLLVIILNLLTCWQSLAGTGEVGGLEKIQFARIINGMLVYDNGESGSTVYPGLATYIIAM